MDLYSRRIVRYVYGEHMAAVLAVKAVENAALNVDNTEGIILHSNLGTQYTSQEFQNMISEKKFIHSFSRILAVKVIRMIMHVLSSSTQF